MDYTTWTLPPQTSMGTGDTAAKSLYEALQRLADPRRGQGKRYQLALILSVLVLAKLAGQQTAAAQRPSGFVIDARSWPSALG